MKNTWKLIPDAMLLLFACTPAPVHSQAAMIRHDPFVRPAPAHGTQGAGKAAAVPPRSERWHPELRGVMRAGADSMASVDGAVLRIGEEINGYRLVEVRDGQAVFSKGTERLSVSMDGLDAARIAGERR